MNFIKLSSYLINVSKIKYIKQEKTLEKAKFIIHLSSNNFSGLSLFGFGYVSTNTNKIIVYKDNKDNDYKIVEDFINKQ